MILVNKVRCLDCNEVITSRSEYGITNCECGNTWCAGGYSILARGGNYEELALHDTDDFELIRERFERGTRGKNMDEPVLRWVPLKDINDEWLENIIIYENKVRTNTNQYLYLFHKEIQYRRYVLRRDNIITDLLS